jgi:hypothetical protein
MPIKDSARPIWGLMWLDRFWQDLRYGFRVLIANPGFTLIAILSLALGIGANTAAFSWADLLLLRPLPVERPREFLAVGSALSVGISPASTRHARVRRCPRPREGFASLARSPARSRRTGTRGRNWRPVSS